MEIVSWIRVSNVILLDQNVLHPACFYAETMSLMLPLLEKCVTMVPQILILNLTPVEPTVNLPDVVMGSSMIWRNVMTGFFSTATPNQVPAAPTASFPFVVTELLTMLTERNATWE